MTTHRDLMKIATGLGLTSITPTSAERIAAIEPLTRTVSDNPILDPGSFPEEIDGRLSGAFEDDWMGSICPQESALERQALEAFERDYPAIVNSPSPNSFWRYQEEVFAYALALYRAGLRHGAAYEHLRSSVVGERKQCRDCYGAGMTRKGDICGTCSGNGTVAHRP